MIRIRSEKIEQIREGVAYVEAELWVSDSESLPDADGISGRQLMPGSIALVQSESSIYVLGFDDEWKKWGEEESPSALTASTNSIGKTALLNSKSLADESDINEEKEFDADVLGDTEIE